MLLHEYSCYCFYGNVRLVAILPAHRAMKMLCLALHFRTVDLEFDLWSKYLFTSAPYLGLGVVIYIKFYKEETNLYIGLRYWECQVESVLTSLKDII